MTDDPIAHGGRTKMSEPNAEKQVGLSLGLRGKSPDGMTVMVPLLVDGDVVGMVESGRADILDLVESRLTDRAPVNRDPESPAHPEPPDGTRIEFQEHGSPGGDLIAIHRDDASAAEAGWPIGDGGTVWCEYGLSVPIRWAEVLADPRLAAAVDGRRLVLAAEFDTVRSELTALRDLRDAVRVLRCQHDRLRDASPLTYEGEDDLAPLFRELDVVDALNVAEVDRG